MGNSDSAIKAVQGMFNCRFGKCMVLKRLGMCLGLIKATFSEIKEEKSALCN